MGLVYPFFSCLVHDKEMQCGTPSHFIFIMCFLSYLKEASFDGKAKEKLFLPTAFTLACLPTTFQLTTANLDASQRFIDKKMLFP